MSCLIHVYYFVRTVELAQGEALCKTLAEALHLGYGDGGAQHRNLHPIINGCQVPINRIYTGQAVRISYTGNTHTQIYFSQNLV